MIHISGSFDMYINILILNNLNLEILNKLRQIFINLNLNLMIVNFLLVLNSEHKININNRIFYS